MPTVQDLQTALAGGGATTGTTANPVTSNPTNASLYGIPEYQMLNPQNGSSSAWQLQSPAAKLYVGSTTQAGRPYSNNAIVAALADKLGIQAKKGQSLQEQVLAALGKRYDTQPTWQALAKKLNAEPMPQTEPQGTKVPSLNHLAMVAGKLGVQVSGPAAGPDQTTTTGDVAKQFLNMTNDQITSLQQQLYNGGWYDSSIYSDPNVNYTPGHLDLYTTMAIGNLLNATASAYSKGTKATWQQVLDSSAQENATQMQSIAAQKKAKITEATSAETQAPLQSAFQSQLGYLPSNADLSKFTSAYDAAQAAHAGQAATQGEGIDFGTGSVPGSGVPVVPGVPSVSAASIPFAQAENPVGYVGHQVSNAYALLLNALGMGRTATSTLPGYNPNITKANTGI